jgi:hypothetical protein
LKSRSPRILTRAARNLESRLDILGAPTRKVKLSEWERLHPTARDVVPRWYQKLLASHRLVGAVLEYRYQRLSYVCLLRLCEPADVAYSLAEGSVTAALPTFGWFPFATESDGSVWVVPAGEEPGPVFLCEHSSWDGGRPTRTNGLLPAADHVAYVLTSMGVSEASYYGDPDGPRNVLWYLRRENRRLGS